MDGYNDELPIFGDEFTNGPHKAYCFDHLIGKRLIRRWYRDAEGRCHKIDGPAVEWEDGRKEWWYHGYKTGARSQQEYERYLRLKAFW